MEGARLQMSTMKEGRGMLTADGTPRGSGWGTCRHKLRTRGRGRAGKHRGEAGLSRMLQKLPSRPHR